MHSIVGGVLLTLDGVGDAIGRLFAGDYDLLLGRRTMLRMIDHQVTAKGTVVATAERQRRMTEGSW